MNTGTISIRYAKALYAYAGRHGSQQATYDHVLAFCSAFRNHPTLKRVMSNRMLSKNRMSEAISASSGAASGEAFDKFARLVVSQRREEFMYLMCLSYIKMVKASLNMIDATVTTATPLDAQTGEHIAARLEKITGKTISLHVEVDPSLIGGYVMQWDTYRLDASVRSALRQIEKRLTTIK